MAGMDWNALCDVTHVVVEDVLDALGPLSRELGVAAGLDNPAAPMGVALDLLPQVVGAAAGRTGQPPFAEADAGQAVQASILAWLIVLLADALLSAVSEAADAAVGVAA